MTKFLVTGASGFVGQSVCAALKAQGHLFVASSRRATSSQDPSYLQIQSLSAETDWSAGFDDVDAVIHLAARTHVMKDTVSDPLAAYRKANVAATVNLARQAVKAGVRRFVYVSSIKVNGESTSPDAAFRDTDMPSPEDEYALSKLEAEQALWEIAGKTGLEVVIVRPPLVYGPGVKANFANLLKIVDSGMPLPFGAIHNDRSLIYVGNLADALIVCATHPAAKGKTYVVSDGEDVSTSQLIASLATALGRPNRNYPVPVSLMRFAARLVGKAGAIDRLTQSLVVDSAGIRRDLDWLPPYNMADGLRTTIAWYRQQKNL